MSLRDSILRPLRPTITFTTLLRPGPRTSSCTHSSLFYRLLHLFVYSFSSLPPSFPPFLSPVWFRFLSYFPSIPTSLPPLSYSPLSLTPPPISTTGNNLFSANENEIMHLLVHTHPVPFERFLSEDKRGNLPQVTAGASAIIGSPGPVGPHGGLPPQSPHLQSSIARPSASFEVPPPDSTPSLLPLLPSPSSLFVFSSHALSL